MTSAYMITKQSPVHDVYSASASVILDELIGVDLKGNSLLPTLIVEVAFSGRYMPDI